MSHWTDNIPQEWGMETLDQSVSKVIDNRGRTAPTAEIGIPLIATNCIKEHGLYPVFEKLRYIDSDTYNNWFRGHPEPNDILFVNKGTPGGVCVVPNPVSFCIAQDMVALRADPDKFDWKYLFAALRSNFVRSQIEALNVGTSIPHLKKTDFNRIVIPKPNISDQKVIGEIYYALCDKIELNLQMNKTLEEMAMTLYKHWFVDFGPFQDGEFVDSELGMIPKGWEVKRLDYIIEIKYGKDHKKLESGNIPVYGSGGIMRYVNQFLYDQDSILIPRKGTLSNLFYLTTPFWSVDTMFYSKIKHKHFGKYVFYFLKTVDLASMDVGSAVPSLTTELLNRIDILIPPILEIEKFDNAVTRYFKVMEANIIENLTLTTLRDTLLPKLISGEVRVKEADKALAEVL